MFCNYLTVIKVSHPDIDDCFGDQEEEQVQVDNYKADGKFWRYLKLIHNDKFLYLFFQITCVVLIK